MWIAPEWSTRLHENQSSAVLSSGFSRYVALADKVLAKEAKEHTARTETEARRERAGASAPAQPDASDVRAVPSEELLALAAPKMALPKPPKHPAYPKPVKVKMPKPRATPTLARPRKVVYPKPPSLPR